MDKIKKTIFWYLMIGIVFYCYTISAALIFQYVVLPKFPSLHAGMGLVVGDSLYFHNLAVDLSEQIYKQGWVVLLNNLQSGQGNVVILAALYAMFGPDPSSVIPTNALLHSASGILLLYMARLVLPGRIGLYGGIGAATLFIIFPSSLNWYSQVHKDSYAIFGYFLVLTAGCKIVKDRMEFGINKIVIDSTLVVAGVFFTAIVRPANLYLYPGLGLLLVIILLLADRRISFKPLFVIVLLMLSPLYSQIKVEKHQLSSSANILIEGYQIDDNEIVGSKSAFLSVAQNWSWKPNSQGLDFLESIPKKMSNFRVFMTSYGVREGAGSMISIEHMPDNLTDFVKFMPRAGLIALYAPFPAGWINASNMVQKVGVFEILFLYILTPGVLFLVYSTRASPITLWLLTTSLYMLTTQGYLLTNLGTLHRIRYPYTLVIIMLGVLGCAIFISRNCLYKKIKSIVKRKLRRNIFIDAAAVDSNPKVDKKSSIRALGKSFVFISINATLFVLLFGRDILLMRELGLGINLDAYQIATALPLFVTAIFAVPLGPVLINEFIRYSRAEDKRIVQKWVSSLSGRLLIVFTLLGVVSSAVCLMLTDNKELDSSTYDLVVNITFLTLPIVALSACTVLGNSILTALGRIQFVALSQLFVPASGVFLILLYSDTIGAYAAIFGLLLGQAFNLVAVYWRNFQFGYSIRPSIGESRWKEFSLQYLPLVVSSALTSATLPVGIFIAASLPSGSVSAFSLGAKVLITITTIFSTLLVAMLLPHFSRLISKESYTEAKSSLGFFLLLGGSLSVPFSLLLFFLASPLSNFLFLGGKVGSEGVYELANVIKFGSLQFPFYVVLAILIKYKVAQRLSIDVLIAAILGQVTNVLSSFYFVENYSTAGIALSMAFGMFMSALILLLLSVVRDTISVKTFFLVSVSWTLFTTIFVCVIYNAYLASGFVFSLFLLYVLMASFSYKKGYGKLSDLSNDCAE